MAYEFYDLLDVGRDASAEELKKAYRKKAMELHPDRHQGDKAKEAEFKKVNEAYATLSDSQKKAVYDRSGGTAADSGFPGGGFQGDFDFSDIFESFFGGGFQAGSRGKRREIGDDIEVRVKTTFEKAVKGGSEEVVYERRHVCPDCVGTGSEKGRDPKACPDCGGSGRVRQRMQTVFGVVEQAVSCHRCRGAGKIIEHPCQKCRGERYVVFRTDRKVDVPAGIEDGMTVKIRAEGHEGIDGNGDLYLHFSVPESEKDLHRDGADLHFHLDLDPAEMALGAVKKVAIPVVGEREIEVKAGSQHGKSVRFRGEGAPKLPSGGKGDLIVTFQVKIPEKLTAKEREFYEAIAKEKKLGEVHGKGILGKLFD
jgi:molecular chaperone DnaJ